MWCTCVDRITGWQVKPTVCEWLPINQQTLHRERHPEMGRQGLYPDCIATRQSVLICSRLLLGFFSHAKPAWRLWARAEWLGLKRKPDDNDEVSSHPANESPDLPWVCLLCKFLLHQQWIKGVANQYFSSQHFSKAIIHKGHTKGTHTLGTSMHAYLHTGGRIHFLKHYNTSNHF